MAHTPGPWEVREPDADERAADIADGAAPEDMELTEVYAEGDGEQICYVMNTTDSESCNARLIAAAPELLGLLKRMLQYIDEYPTGGYHMKDVLRQCKSAIAKAEGRGE